MLKWSVKWHNIVWYCVCSLMQTCKDKVNIKINLCNIKTTPKSKNYSKIWLKCWFVHRRKVWRLTENLKNFSLMPLACLKATKCSNWFETLNIVCFIQFHKCTKTEKCLQVPRNFGHVFGVRHQELCDWPGLVNLLCRNTLGTQSPSFLLTVSLRT